MKIADLFEEDYPSVLDMTFTKDELLFIYRNFLDRLERLGNDRDEMIKYHIDKLVGIPYKDVLRKKPRGPKDRWWGLMADINEELHAKAEWKAYHED